MIAVTGATGAVGGRVADRLAERGLPLRLVVRDAERAPRLEGAEVGVAAGYHDHAGMVQALRGTSTLFLVSARESRNRVAEHASAVDAALEAGVGHVVYLSFLSAAPDCTFTFGRDHWATEQHVRARGLTHTFLRDSLYADFAPQMMRGPAGGGRVSWVYRDDVADVAAAVLADPGAHRDATYRLTGPEALTLPETAARLGLTFADETLEDAYAARAGQGERFEIEGWVTSYLAVARGELEAVSGDVARLTGRPARALGG